MAMSRPRPQSRTRPVSAPPQTAKRYSPCAGNGNRNVNDNHPAVLIPSLPNAFIMGAMSRAEIEAWATLPPNTEDESRGHSARRHCESRPMVTFDKRDRPTSASEKQYYSHTRAGDTATQLDRQRPTTVMKKPRDEDIFCAYLEHPDGCKPARVEQEDTVRQRQIERDRSGISARQVTVTSGLVHLPQLAFRRSYRYYVYLVPNAKRQTPSTNSTGLHTGTNAV